MARVAEALSEGLRLPSLDEATLEEEDAPQEQPQEISFMDQIQRRTRDIRNLSRAIVMTKFQVVLSDDSVWADGLLAFHEIFRFLESNLSEQILPNVYHRYEAFERDLIYFMGTTWQAKYKTRPSVVRYLNHLESVRSRGEIYLFAYAYHLYMVLLTDFQLYQKKRITKRKGWSFFEVFPRHDFTTAGCNITNFQENISSLRVELDALLNRHFSSLDPTSRKVFFIDLRRALVYNIEVIRSIKQGYLTTLKKLMGLLLILSIPFICILLTKKDVKGSE